jgi:flagellar motor switch protein FliN
VQKEALQPLAEEMFAAATGAFSTLAGLTATAGAATMESADGSFLIESDIVATLTRVPANGVAFVTRFVKADIGRVVEMMLGSSSGGGEMDAMQLSIVAETVAQIATSMGESLAQHAGAATDGVHSEVVADAAGFPVPPFTTAAAPITVGDGLETRIVLAFDGLAISKLDLKDPEPPAGAVVPEPPPARPVAPPAETFAAAGDDDIDAAGLSFGAASFDEDTFEAPPAAPPAFDPPSFAPAAPSVAANAAVAAAAAAAAKAAAQAAAAQASAAPPPMPPVSSSRQRQTEGQAAQFTPMQPTPIRPAAPGQSNLDLVHDVPLEISAVLGQTELSLREVVAMQPGSVFELDKLSTEPIDLYVNNILIARGEVVVVDDKFAVKISELNPVVDRV